MNEIIETTNTVNNIYELANLNTNNLIQFPKSNIKTNVRKQIPSHIQSKTVQPMKDKQDIERAKEYFLTAHSRYSNINLRNYCLFVLGINCARRISDILDLRVCDVLNSKGNFPKDGWIYITEQKTGKQATFQLHPYVQEAIKQYLDTQEDIKPEDYLFKSRKINKNGEYKLDSKSAWRIMNEMSKALDLDYNVGTHTMRKTWAYQTIQANKDDPYIVAAVSHELNHSSVGVTYRYSGFDKEVRSHLYMDNPL